MFVCVCACAYLRVSRAATCTCMLDSTYEGGAVPSCVRDCVCMYVCVCVCVAVAMTGYLISHQWVHVEQNS